MKNKLKLVLAFAFFCTAAFAQKPSGVKGSLIGIHFNLADFKGPIQLEDNSVGRGYSSIKDMNQGFSISYWKGLNKKIDFSVKANAIFRDYAGIYRGVLNKTEVGLELEPTINIRPYTDASKVAPFLTAGVGGGFYGGKFGAYAPAGAGVQINIKNVSYLFVQAQYKFTLTDKILGDNLFYSIGFAENMGKRKPSKNVVIPPVPVTEDKDSDGVLDSLDKCPDVAGIAAMQGCPDKDSDGISDASDKCPDVAGLAKNQGCPTPDTDKDGINDEEDKCPDQYGFARYQGCPIPDVDKDGVNDEEDKCITDAGPASNAGCPVIDKSIVAKINLAARNLIFASGSSKLLPKSYKSLNEVAKIMSANTSFKLEINGHTDNQGKAEKNLALSEIRAKAVKAYLVRKGVTESRMTAVGHGQDMPAFDNKTVAGRAKNRRVQLNVSNR
jgi:OmpA-OmpF porin, OOP family